MATGYDVYVYIIYGHRAISCIGHRRGAKNKAVRRSYRDCTGVVGRSCDFCAVTVTYSRKSYIDRAIPVQRLCEDRKVKVSSLNATYDVFKGYDLTIWKIRTKIVQSSYATAGRSCD